MAPSAGYRCYIRRKRLVIGALAAVLVAVVTWSLCIGSAALTPAEVLRALLSQGDEYSRIVVWNLRMPRVLTAIVGGVALAVSGCAFQSALRNPLASASTLGVSQGAAFGASVAIICFGAGGGAAAYEGARLAGNPYLVAICAFAGAMLSTLTIIGLSRARQMSAESIVLAGVALSALFTGGTTTVQYFAEDSQVAAVIFWTFGDLSRASWQEIALMAVVAAAAAAFFFWNRWSFNAIEAGEVSAHSLGVDVRGVRLASLFAASLAASCVIAFCGIINFVGLVAPHVMRRFIGSDYRYLLPASALAGAVLLLASDICANVVVAPLILPISAITSFVGAPLFVYLLFRGVGK